MSQGFWSRWSGEVMVTTIKPLVPGNDRISHRTGPSRKSSTQVRAGRGYGRVFFFFRVSFVHRKWLKMMEIWNFPAEMNLTMIEFDPLFWVFCPRPGRWIYCWTVRLVTCWGERLFPVQLFVSGCKNANTWHQSSKGLFCVNSWNL